MDHSYGPWATAMHSGSNAQLSTFWRRRLSRLPTVSESNVSLSRPAIALLGLLAVAIFAVPTIRAWAASNESVAQVATAPPSAAVGQRAAQVAHKARSYKFAAINEISHWDNDDSIRVEETGYWLACGSERQEAIYRWKATNKPFTETTEIRLAGKPGLFVHRHDKSYQRSPPFRDNFLSPFDDLESLASLCAQAERQKGVKRIDGRQSRGFVVDVKKIDGDIPITAGFREIWIDVETNLPILIHSKMMREDFTSDRVAHYQWNLDLDPKLFDPTPPAGYKDITTEMVTAESLPLEEQTRRIAAAFTVYAETCGGHYPRKRSIGSDVELELAGKLGLTGWPLTSEETKKEPYATGRAGFREVQQIGRFRPDVVYNGKTVGPGDKDKVLLRWKLDDGRYAVIYGDLHSETVTAGRLQTLERR